MEQIIAKLQEWIVLYGLNGETRGQIFILDMGEQRGIHIKQN